MSTLESFCSRMPKVELHAHLNGSLSEKTLYELFLLNPDVKCDDAKNLALSYQMGANRSLEDCFKNFNIAHAVTVSPDAVTKGTRDVISEFAAENVIYLELRTTPREVPGVMSKKQYIQAVVDGIRSTPTFVGPNKFIVVKLLLSVNRQNSQAQAEENIREAIEAHTTYPDIVVGVDLSGHPSCGNVIDTVLPLFLEARTAGLKIALHCAEVPNENEVEAILKFRADRLGHGTCIHPNYGGTQSLWNLLLESQVPLEVCLTSNVKCHTVESYVDHHLQHLLPLQYPFVISTDDKGVFSTTLSREFHIAAETFNMSQADLCRCTEVAVGAAFATSEEKRLMMEKVTEFKIQEGLQ